MHDRVARGYLACALALPAVSCIESGHLRQQWTAMGARAEVELQARTTRVAERGLQQIQQAYQRARGVLDVRDPQSELNRLNREASQAPYHVQDADLYRCIRISVEWARVTEGAFDPTIGPLRRAYGLRDGTLRLPSKGELADAVARSGWRNVKLYPEANAVRLLAPEMQLDLTHILHGYALDIAARNFASIGFEAGLLRLGGVVYAWNHPSRRSLWKVPIVGPQDPDSPIGTVELSGRALAVTGSLAPALGRDASPVPPVIDSAAGRPADTDVLAVAIVADSAADADALGTAIRVMGSQRGAALLGRSERVEALLLVRGAGRPQLLASGSLQDRLSVDEGVEQRLGGVRFLLPPLELP